MSGDSRQTVDSLVFRELIAEDREHFRTILGLSGLRDILRIQPVGASDQFIRTLDLAVRFDADRMRVFLWHLEATEYVVRVVMEPAYAPRVLYFAWSEVPEGGPLIFESYNRIKPGMTIPQLYARANPLPTLHALRDRPGFVDATFNPATGTFNTIYDHAARPALIKPGMFKLVCELHRGEALVNSREEAERVAAQSDFCPVCRLWRAGLRQ